MGNITNKIKYESSQLYFSSYLITDFIKNSLCEIKKLDK